MSFPWGGLKYEFRQMLRNTLNYAREAKETEREREPGIEVGFTSYMFFFFFFAVLLF